MPLYEYACASCKKKIEVLQGFNEKPIKNCPHCGGKLKKLMSSPAIQFKGSGWYVTDYGGKSRPRTPRTRARRKLRSPIRRARGIEDRGEEVRKAGEERERLEKE